MSLKVEIQNIGGLRGNHSFNLHTGLNLLKSPNASGKSSLLNAIYLLIANKNIPQNELIGFLTENEVGGYAKIIDSTGNKSEIHLTKGISGKVEISKSIIKIGSDAELNMILSFLREKSKLNIGIQNADETSIENWFQDVTKVNKFHTIWKICQNITQDLEINVDKLKGEENENIDPLQKYIDEMIIKKDKKIKQRDSVLNDPENIKNETIAAEIKEKIISVNDEISNMKNDMKNIPSFQNLQKNLQNKEQELIHYEDEYQNLKNQQEILILKNNELEEKSVKIKNSITDSKNDFALIEEKYKESSKKLSNKNKIKNRSVCPLCDSKIERKKTDEFIKEYERAVNEYFDRKENLSNKITINKNELKKILKNIDKNQDLIKNRPKKLSKNIGDTKKEIKDSKIKIKEIKEKTKRNEENLENKQRELDELNEKLSKNLNPEQEKKVRKLKEEIRDLNSDIFFNQEKIERFLANNDDLILNSKRLTISEQFTDYYRSRIDLIRKKMVVDINNKLEESFKLLQLAELERITLDPERFTLTIQRIDKSYTTLNTFSGAERALISLIIGYIVHKTVLPDDPIFLVDEVTSEMDDTRFKEILNYMAKEIPYLVVARHSPYQGKRNFITSNEILNKI